jgi:hypothetical protein
MKRFAITAIPPGSRIFQVCNRMPETYAPHFSLSTSFHEFLEAFIGLKMPMGQFVNGVKDTLRGIQGALILERHSAGEREALLTYLIGINCILSDMTN